MSAGQENSQHLKSLTSGGRLPSPPPPLKGRWGMRMHRNYGSAYFNLSTVGLSVLKGRGTISTSCCRCLKVLQSFNQQTEHSSCWTRQSTQSSTTRRGVTHFAGFRVPPPFTPCIFLLQNRRRQTTKYDSRR